MTTLDTSFCWAVLAPLPTEDLQSVVAHEWKRDSPYAIDLPPFEAVSGAHEYAALICSSPGSEGAAWHFAEILSIRVQGRIVYSLWLDPERQHIFEWVNGKQTASFEGDPLEVAESLGFDVSRRAAVKPARSVVVVEKASVSDVHKALGDMVSEPWIHVTPGPTGVLVTAEEGPLGTQAWDIAEVLPTAMVYYMQRRVDPSEFTVLVLQGPKEVGRFRIPALDDDTETLIDIKGSQTPETILGALGIPPELVGLT